MVDYGLLVGDEADAVARNAGSGAISSSGGHIAVIVIGDANVIAANRIARTVGGCDGCGGGISVEGGQGNLVTANDIARTAADGIDVDAFDPNPPTLATVVRGNLVRGAGDDGIAIATNRFGAWRTPTSRRTS